MAKFKLVTIITEPIIASRIEEEIIELGSSGTTTTQVEGEGSRNLQSGEIPGSKIKIECIVSPPVAEQLMAFISDKYFKDYSVIVYASDVEVLRPDKFKEKSKS